MYINLRAAIFLSYLCKRTLFDNNAETIISGLFKAYYNNPRLLHKGTQRKLYINLRNISENVVDFEYGNHEVIKEEFDMITNENLEKLSTEDAAEYKEKKTCSCENHM